MKWSRGRSGLLLQNLSSFLGVGNEPIIAGGRVLLGLGSPIGFLGFELLGSEFAHPEFLLGVHDTSFHLRHLVVVD